MTLTEPQGPPPQPTYAATQPEFAVGQPIGVQDHSGVPTAIAASPYSVGGASSDNVRMEYNDDAGQGGFPGAGRGGRGNGEYISVLLC